MTTLAIKMHLSCYAGPFERQIPAQRVLHTNEIIFRLNKQRGRDIHHSRRSVPELCLGSVISQALPRLRSQGTGSPR